MTNKPLSPSTPLARRAQSGNNSTTPEPATKHRAPDGVLGKGGFGAWGKIVGVVPILIGLWLILVGGARDENLPPDLAKIKGTSCIAQLQETILVEKGVEHEERRYLADATATYADGRPEWKKLLAVRSSMKDAARDCVDWVNMVRREQDKLKAKAKRTK